MLIIIFAICFCLVLVFSHLYNYNIKKYIQLIISHKRSVFIKLLYLPQYFYWCSGHCSFLKTEKNIEIGM